MFQCLSHSNSCCSSYSVKGTVVKQIFILNKNIVHLINNMFWYMGFKTESQAKKVILMINFILIIPFITIITLIRIICIIARYVKILDLQITCGRTKGLLLPKQLMTWAISFVLPCALAGFPTSVRPTRTTQPLLPARQWGRARWCFQTELIVLPFATNTNLA